MIIIIAFSFAVLPVWIGTILNVLSMVISIRHVSAIAAQMTVRSPDESSIENRRLEYKGVKTISLISLVNVITWLPAMVRLSYPLFRKQGTTDVIPIWLDHVLLLLTMVNFWSNAPIFARTNLAYRHAGKALVRSIFCKDRSPEQEITLNSRISRVDHTSIIQLN